MRQNTEVRTWVDRNGDLVPQLDEIGPGQGGLDRGANVRIASGLKRPSQWEATASLDHQLAARPLRQRQLLLPDLQQPHRGREHGAVPRRLRGAGHHQPARRHAAHHLQPAPRQHRPRRQRPAELRRPRADVPRRPKSPSTGASARTSRCSAASRSARTRRRRRRARTRTTASTPTATTCSTRASSSTRRASTGCHGRSTSRATSPTSPASRCAASTPSRAPSSRRCGRPARTCCWCPPVTCASPNQTLLDVRLGRQFRANGLTVGAVARGLQPAERERVGHRSGNRRSGARPDLPQHRRPAGAVRPEGLVLTVIARRLSAIAYRHIPDCARVPIGSTWTQWTPQRFGGSNMRRLTLRLSRSSSPSRPRRRRGRTTSRTPRSRSASSPRCRSRPASASCCATTRATSVRSSPKCGGS